MSEASEELMVKAVHLQRQNRLAEAMAAYGAILARWPNARHYLEELSGLRAELAELA